MGLLWPGLMGTYGEVIGLPFAIEGVRLLHRGHLRRHLPVRLGPAARRGRHLLIRGADRGRRRRVGVLRGDRERLDEPAARASTSSTARSPTSTRGRRCSTRRCRPQTVAHDPGRVHGRRVRHRRRVRGRACCAGAATTGTTGSASWCRSTVAARRGPVQIGGRRLGRALRRRATSRPSWPRSRASARPSAASPLHVGGICVDGELRYAHRDPGRPVAARRTGPGRAVQGLDGSRRPTARRSTWCTWPSRPMVGIGFGLLALGRAGSRWPGGGGATCPARLVPAARVAVPGWPRSVALESGWVDDRGRPPAVDRVRRAAHRRRGEPGAGLSARLLVVAAIYVVLTVATVYVLRRLAPPAATSRPVAPQEADVAAVDMP